MQILKLTGDNIWTNNPVVLYNVDPSNAANSATMSQSIGNFKRLKVFFIDSGGSYLSNELYTNNAVGSSSAPLYFTVFGGVPNGRYDTLYTRFARYAFTSGTTLEFKNVARIDFHNTPSIEFTADNDAIKVYRVEGYYE